MHRSDPARTNKFLYEIWCSAVSVLTDKRFFKGSISDLESVRKAIDAPILCKDFVIDPIQIDWLKMSGANIILLNCCGYG